MKLYTLLTAALLSSCVVGAAAAQTTQTKSYTYEWIHLRANSATSSNRLLLYGGR